MKKIIYTVVQSTLNKTTFLAATLCFLATAPMSHANIPCLTEIKCDKTAQLRCRIQAETELSQIDPQSDPNQTAANDLKQKIAFCSNLYCSSSHTCAALIYPVSLSVIQAEMRRP